MAHVSFYQPDRGSLQSWFVDQLSRRGDLLLVVVSICGLAAGVAFWWFGAGAKADLAWTLATVPVLAALLVQIVTSLRHGDIGLDIVAALSMSAALAFGESL